MIVIKNLNCSLTFTAIVLQRYWLFLGSPLDSPASFQAKFQANYSLDNDVPASSINCTFQDKLFIEGYFLGSVALLSIVLVLLIALITQSAKGNIFDEAPRKLVVPLLYFK